VDDQPTVPTYLGVIGRITFLTLVYWLVGTTPEENHASKGDAWARVRAYRWAAWHFRKYLKYSDDSFGRASLGWCYLNLGMPESAVHHYREAYVRSKGADVVYCLAHAELEVGNVGRARALVADLAARRDELSPELLTALADVEARLSACESKTTDSQFESGDPPDSPTHDLEFHSKSRLFSALVNAYVAYGAAYFAVTALAFLSSTRNSPAQFFNLISAALVNGVICCLGLLVCAPILAWVQIAFGRQFRRLHAGLIGAALAPVPALFAVVILDMMSGNPIGTWIRWWIRFPGYLLLWLLPFAFGGIVFALTFANTRASILKSRSNASLRPVSGEDVQP